MLFIVSLVLALVFALGCSKPLRRNPIPFYLGAAVTAAAVLTCIWTNVVFPAWFRDSVWAMFSRAAFSTALFALVMVTGALPNGSKGMKLLMPLRGQLSILASILTLGHNAGYAKTYFRLLFTNPGRLSTNQLAAAIFSVIMIVIMIPLFITSFLKVRKKMDPRSWKKLQRLAYPFYGLIYLHVMLLSVPSALRGVSGYRLTIFAYSVVFLSYTICRVLKALAMRDKKTQVLFKRQCAGVICGLAVACVIVGSVSAVQGTGRTTDAPARETVPDSGISSPASENGDPENQNAVALPTAGPSQEADDPESGNNTETVDTSPSPDAEDPAAGPNDPPAPSIVPEQTPAAEVSPAVTATPSPEATPAPTPTPTPAPTPEPVNRYRNGTFTGTGQGYWSTITAAVTLQNDVITAINISGGDDEPYFTNAKAIINTVLSLQTTNLDAVSGATYSSYGILDAIDAALAAAKN